MKFLSDLLPVIIIRRVPYVYASEESFSAVLSHRLLLCHIQSQAWRVRGFLSVLLFCPQTQQAGRDNCTPEHSQISCLAPGLSEEHSVKSCVEELTGSVDPRVGVSERLHSAFKNP